MAANWKGQQKMEEKTSDDEQNDSETQQEAKGFGDST